jgi:glycosyltransferase involved in cell wall biosynthesis
MLLGHAVRLLREEDSGHSLGRRSRHRRPHQASLLGDGVALLGYGPHTELTAIYTGCHVFAFPSLSEIGGNVVAEAMASGLPPGLPAGARTVQWLAEPGRNGLLVVGDRPATGQRPCVP